MASTALTLRTTRAVSLSIQAASSCQRQLTSRLSSAQAPKSSSANTPRVARSRTCMRAAASSLVGAHLRTRNMKTSLRSRRSLKITILSRLVDQKTTLMTLFRSTCRMKRARRLVQRARRKRKRRITCLPKRRSCSEKIRCQSRRLMRTKQI